MVAKANCPTVDIATMNKIHNKRDLITYLHEKDCPELKKMEADLAERSDIDG